MKEVIVCAANYNKEHDIIVCGVRHFDMIMHGQIHYVNAVHYPKAQGSEWKQGFVNQFGEFRDRKQALIIAREAGQLDNKVKSGNPNSDELFSEDLY